MRGAPNGNAGRAAVPGRVAVPGRAAVPGRFAVPGRCICCWEMGAGGRGGGRLAESGRCGDMPGVPAVEPSAF